MPQVILHRRAQIAMDSLTSPDRQDVDRALRRLADEGGNPSGSPQASRVATGIGLYSLRANGLFDVLYSVPNNDVVLVEDLENRTAARAPREAVAG
jgi:hypothetical protein